MNSHDLFDMIGDAREDFVWDAQQARNGAVHPGPRKLSSRRLLMVAVIVLSLLLVGCTVAYVQGWFADFFTAKSQQPLSDSQLAFLEENEQAIHKAVTINGWTLELGSVISDGTHGSILIGVTAPEGTSLDQIAKNNILMSHVIPGNSVTLRRSPSLLTLPEGVVSSYSYCFQEDGDGLPHTADLLIRLNPDPEACTADPFSKDSIYRITVQDIYRETVNEEVWDGVSDIVTFDNAWIEECLVEGTWEFSFHFGLNQRAVVQQELLTAPFSTTALHWRQFGEDPYEDGAWFVEEHTVTSFVLKPLSAVISYEPKDDRMSQFAWGSNVVWAVMQDGREVKMANDFGGGTNTYLLQVSAPIVLEEVDHIRMVDGTKIYMDGRVEPPAWKTDPLPPPPESLIPGETTIREMAAYYAEMPVSFGTYAYYTDFDGDTVPEIAVWQDGCYIALCRMTVDGILKEAVNFESPLTIAELCTQFGGENAKTLERHEILKPIEMPF